ncbi:hypothetical protein HIM_10787 [Hirsutella minnesotensis 3608]|uniref:Uncharacterized protein n=1 Tax=Hirsutella minnesotensis 3608 TaxID=1043627 RepID=A0A0F8A1Y0_9HYPO|nr:hypothetical protein HIM_10787 [Hirsutella minnesotensis 3608]
MASVESLSDDGLAYLFGLGFETQVHHNWLSAASTFSKIRQKLEIDAKKLQTLKPSTFHKSTKKKLFRTSMENAANAKLESRVLLPLIDDCTIPPAQALRQFILVCYSFQHTQYEEIVSNGLVDIFPRLMRGITIDVSMAPTMESIFNNIIRDVWNKAEGNERRLSFLNGDEHGGHGQFFQGQLQQSHAKSLPVWSKGFAYEGADAATLEPLFGNSRLLSGVQRSSRWILERSVETPSQFTKITRCLSAFAPIDMGEDIEFRIRTSWPDGWEIISSLGFKESKEVDVMLL